MASPLSETSSETDVLELETDEQSGGGIVSSVELVPKKNTKLPVWNYFGFTTDEEARPMNCCLPKCELSSRMYQ